MALEFHSGFETGDGSEWASITGAPDFHADYANTGNYGMRCNASGSAIYLQARSLDEHRRGTFYLYISSMPSSDCCIAGEVDNANHLKLTTDGYIDLYDDVAKLADGAVQLSTGQWYRISWATNGSNSFKTYIDGNEDISYESAIQVVNVLGVVENVTAVLYFDDYAVDDELTDNDIGDINVKVALPVANGNQNDFDQTSGFGFCNNLPDDTDYVENNQSGTNREQFGVTTMTNLGISGATPLAINVIIRQDRNGGGATTHSINVRDNATDFETATAGTAAWTQYAKYYATLPSGGGAWSEARFDALEAGTYHAGPQDQRCSTVNVMLAYIPVAAALSINVYDSIAVTESVSVEIPVLEVSVYDSIGVSDDVSVSIPSLTLDVDVYDSIDVTDAVTVLIPFWEVSVYDSIDVAEDVTVVVDWGVYVSDSIGVTDAVSISIPVYEVNVSDSIGLTDATSVEIPILEISVYDSIDVTDDVSLLIPFVGPVAVYDSIDVADAIAVEITVLEISVYDSVGVTDAISVEIPILEISVYDSIGVADDVDVSIVVLALNVDVYDSIDVTDAVTVLIPFWEVSVYDSIDVAEAISLEIPILEIAVYDSIAITEDTSLQITVYEVSVFDSVDVTDAVGVEFTFFEVSVYDSISVADSITVASLYSISVFDSIDVSDSTSVESKFLSISVYDTIGGLLTQGQINTLDGQLDVVRNLLRRIAVTNTHSITVDVTNDYTKLNTKLQEVDARVRRIGVTNY